MSRPAVPSATTIFDSILFRDAFGTPRMREIFSDYALIGRYAEVEIALARAEARCGVIPAEAAEQIAKLSEAFELKAGDIIYSGTPENVGPVVKGDVLLCKLEGLPDMSIRIA